VNRTLGQPFRVQGLAYADTHGAGATWVADLVAAGAALLGLDLAPPASDIANEDSALGTAYGEFSPEHREIVAMAVRLEGLLLDPVYTATGMATLRRMAAAGRLKRDDTVVFLHTGGLPALFAYGADILGA